MGTLYDFNTRKVMVSKEQQVIDMLKCAISEVRKGDISAVGIFKIMKGDDGGVIADWCYGDKTNKEMAIGAEHLKNAIWKKIYAANSD